MLSPLDSVAVYISTFHFIFSRSLYLLHQYFPVIEIVFAGDVDITLPQNHTRISSSTSPLPQEGQNFVYKWEKVSGPNQGSLTGINTDQLELTGVSHRVCISTCIQGELNSTVLPASSNFSCFKV